MVEHSSGDAHTSVSASVCVSSQFLLLQRGAVPTAVSVDQGIFNNLADSNDKFNLLLRGRSWKNKKSY